MSTMSVRHLTCDKPLCSARFFRGDGSAPETVLRHEARAAGWTEKDGLDYCPSHQPWPGFASWASAKVKETVASDSQTLADAANRTHSPSDRLAYAMDAWLVTHPDAPLSTEADYPGWTPGGAA